MAIITVRNHEDGLKRRLHIRTEENDRSMGEEAFDILRAALYDQPPAQEKLASAIRTSRQCRTGHSSTFTHAQTTMVRLRKLR